MSCSRTNCKIQIEYIHTKSENINLESTFLSSNPNKFPGLTNYKISNKKAMWLHIRGLRTPNFKMTLYSHEKNLVERVV